MPKADGHMSSDELARYQLDQADDAERVYIAQHLQWCQYCIDQRDAIEHFLRPVLPGHAAVLRVHTASARNIQERWTAVCEEKARLSADYETATAKFSEAVTYFHGRIGVSPKAEYDRLNRAADEWRLKSEQARIALEQHIAAHGC